MKALAKRLSRRICSISVYDYKAYIYFMLILLFCMLDYIITQVMVNYYGYVVDPYYKRSIGIIWESLLLGYIKMFLCCRLISALVDNPIEKETQIRISILQVRAKSSRIFLIIPMWGIMIWFGVSVIYDLANYVLIAMCS